MRLEHESQEQLERQILGIVRRHLPEERYRIFFFGSRVAGKSDERSDIDVGIEGEKPVASEIMARIKDEISELPILYRIDVVDFLRVGKDFRLVAKKRVEEITRDR